MIKETTEVLTNSASSMAGGVIFGDEEVSIDNLKDHTGSELGKKIFSF